ncbi:MAG: oxidoreductase [Devosiaceae bacterium]|nr:oxidoreductase [Devosiaceae bacterium MH13]
MIALIAYLSPLAMFAAALLAARGPQFRPRETVSYAEMATIFAIFFAAVSLLVLLSEGPMTSPALGLDPIALSARIDIVSVTMMLLVATVGWVVVRFAGTYLDGEAEQGRFTMNLCLTLGSVMLFVQAGTVLQLIVAWLGVGCFLQQLLLFYRDRVEAQRAGRKKLLMSRIGDGALILAGVSLFIAFGTWDIATILDLARDGSSDASSIWAIISAGLLALSALFKSAQFPTHGWLTEVMETPTPVSALLHAGVINAGGFLLIRFADVMLLAPGILAVLVIVGGFSALFGGLVMLTQSAVKTSLAWSTVAQMGFMILQCGLALFPIALLHIVAHSLYKAHAFLASGGNVELVASIKRPGPVAIPSGWAVLRAFGAALSLYFLAGLTFGFEDKSPQAIALGAILIFGVAYLLAQGLADKAPWALTIRTGLASVATAFAYFALQSGAEWVTAGTLPATPAPGPLEWALMTLAVISFGLVAWAQAMFPLWAYHPAAAGLRVHLSNGLYANALTDRLLGGWKAGKPAMVRRAAVATSAVSEE